MSLPQWHAVAAAAYDAMKVDVDAQNLLRDLQQGIADADAGRVVDHDAVMRELRDRYAGRVPPAVLQELGG